MPCGYANPTEIGARERFNVGIFIFRVRPLQVCSVLLRWAIPGPRLVERAMVRFSRFFVYRQNRRAICHCHSEYMGTHLLKSIFLISLVCLTSIVTYAHDFEVDGIYYDITDPVNKEVAVTFKESNSFDYNEYSGKLVIPVIVTNGGTTYAVTSIGDLAFSSCSSLTSVTIPNSVTSIGNYAFWGCSGLTSVTIPNSVTSIGKDAFYGCSGLTSVTIPNSVTSIGEDAFRFCSGLTSIVVETGNTKYDSRENCNAIINSETNELIVGCKNTIIPNSVTSIGNYAFEWCSGLTSITIPNSVTSIGEYAFYNCDGLTSVTIPNSVTRIGKIAFYDCSGLTSVTIGNSVNSIGDLVFYNCLGLTSVTIPNSVTSIGHSAFKDCSGLTSVTFGNSVTSIGNSAFFGCWGLTSVTIPNSVTSIGNFAFCDCHGLTSMVVETGNTKYDSRENCNAIIDSETNELIVGCKNTIIPNSVTSIGNSAFKDCDDLTSIIISNSVTSIGNSAFYNCI